ncbi:glycosyltransferase family 2 protein [Flavobacterium sp. LB2P6]|uniref:glycosyltransferase family 2 protein n=1 Tax=Flavobacterium sp. LB2P6 TaxID=3401714 RepID=UPI003AAA9782
MEKIKFSIITIVYNGEEYIENTLKSVINQTYKNFEFIVIDGSSKDNTTDIIKKYLGSITTFISENDSGIYDAMNKGLKYTNGNYVVFMNGGDCFANSNILNIIYKCLLQEEVLPDFIYGDTIVAIPTNIQFYKKARSHRYNWYGMFANHQAMFYKMSVINENKITYDTFYNIAADYKFTLEFLKKSQNRLYVPESICIFSMDGISNTNKELGLKEAERARKEILKYSNFRNMVIRQIIYLSRFLSDKISPIYNMLRYSK